MQLYGFSNTFFNRSINRSVASFTSCSVLVPVQTIFPLLKRRKVALVPLSLCTKPGNCSGSYSVLGSFKPSTLRFKSMPMLPEATIFWTVIFGLMVTWIFNFLRLLMILWILRSTCSIVLAPVQTIFPLEKIRADVLGSLIRNTKPGNCSGLYSVLGKVAAIFSKGMSFSRLLEITILTIVISFLEVILELVFAIFNMPPV